MNILLKVPNLLLIVFICIVSLNCIALDQCLDLTIDYKSVCFAAKNIHKAIAVNNQIPGPTLHFKQGDRVKLKVKNNLNEKTTIHWHGLLVPWQMDGVENVAQKGIEPGCEFRYEFKLMQAGTYWYHAHAGTQEQDGLYGAIIVDPIDPPNYHYTKDYVVVLSDWSNALGEQVFANLKKTGDYYSSLFPLQPSLQKFMCDYLPADCKEREKILEDYKTMQKMRMSLYDLSDIAYDAYLLNGCTQFCPWTAQVQVGDVVRLRFIGAASSTIYRVKIPNEMMEMVHVQGNDVVPHKLDDFSIAPGETYDVLVKIKSNKPYIIYAESIDTLGKVYGALVTDRDSDIDFCSIEPFPEPEPVTRMMMHENHENKKMQPMHEMPTEPTTFGDTFGCNHNLHQITKGTKYRDLISLVETNNPNLPVEATIKMELFGYMDSFIWFINGLPEYLAEPIHIHAGKRYRIIFTNNSMMRHPMHIHGHWFIFRKGEGAYDPLLHTIEVAPGETIIADFDADASGQWFFHCHHLYHMMAGMARVFQYKSIIEIAEGCAQPQSKTKQTAYINRPIVRKDITYPLDCSLIPHPMGHHEGFYFSNYLELGEDPFHNIQEMTFKGLYGGDYNKLELFVNDSSMDRGTVDEADLDIFYWRLISQFWAIKGGVNYFYRPGGPYWQPGLGIEGLTPYFIDTNLRAYYYKKSFKLDCDLSRDTQITNNFFIRAGIRGIMATKTVAANEIGSGLNQMRITIRPFYRIAPGLNVYVEYEHEQEYGVLKSIFNGLGKSTKQDTFTFGIAVLF